MQGLMREHQVRGSQGRGPRTSVHYLQILATAYGHATKVPRKPLKHPVPSGNSWQAAISMTALRNAVFDKCQERLMGSKSSCSKWLLEPFTNWIIQMKFLTARSVFTDFGMADANLVWSLATRIRCECVGVELTKANFELAKSALPHFVKYWNKHRMGVPTPTLHGDNLLHVLAACAPAISWLLPGEGEYVGLGVGVQPTDALCH